jgi:predicted alpha/beta hydrolase
MMTQLSTQIARIPIAERIRKNHGLEHASIHVLTERGVQRPLAGRSDPNGFYIYGDVSTDQLQAAVENALQRMKAGEHHLAVHPNCGTMFVTSGAMSALVAFLAMLGTGASWRKKLERAVLLVSLLTVTLIFSQPVGYAVQREITTTGIMDTLQVVSITRKVVGGMVTHRVETRL